MQDNCKAVVYNQKQILP